MALLERLLVALAQRHHRRHVDLVEGREHRGGALRLDEPPGDRRAPLRHAHALFGALAGAASRAASATGGGRLRARRRVAARGCGAADSPRGRLLDVAPHDAPGIAAALHACSRSTSFSSAALRAVGVERVSLAAAFSLSTLRRWRRLPAGACAAALARFGGRRAGVRACGFVDHAEHLADLHVLAVLAIDPARARRPAAPPTSRSILSVSSSTSGSPAATDVAFLAQPLRDARVDDRLTDFRDDDVRLASIVCHAFPDAAVSLCRPAGPALLPGSV